MERERRRFERRMVCARAFSGKVESGFPSENAATQKGWSGFGFRSM
jgi:hypothetical protein